MEIIAAPAQHFSGRTIRTRNATLWSSFVVRGAGHTVFFGADTGLTTLYRDIAAKFGKFDVAMLEVGAYHPAWGDIHLGPDNAIKALEMLGNPPFIPIHWGTFNLAMHPWDAPVERLAELAPRAGVSMMVPRPGDAVEPAAGARAEPWWRTVAKRRGKHAQAPPPDHTPPGSWHLD